MVTGAPSGVLIQVSMPIRSGAGPQLASASAADRQVSHRTGRARRGGVRRVLAGCGTRWRQLLQGLLGGVVSLDGVLDGRGVGRHPPLQAVGQVEGQRHREGDHDDAAGDPESAGPGPQPGDPTADVLPGVGEQQQRDGGADRERRGQHQDTLVHPAGGTGDRDGRDHRAGARHVQGTQREAEDERTARPGPRPAAAAG